MVSSLSAPLKRKSFVRIDESTIHQMHLLSTEKRDCESYLLENYPLKACMDG
jgi:hypothetical protein